ncbi:DUF2889 domain-containing protein [Sphingomonas flavalba]|uniref:DUF2889 domain-containing protein n=1 Tax=Sphingomonas flavalba TaxID=2559804 RepID=UPI0039E047DF
MSGDRGAAPGFRRRILVLPARGQVTAELEDDYHRMTVTLSHAEGIVVSVAAEMQRWPWTTCPGAVAQLSRTFVGRALSAVAGAGKKNRNCTHLYDLTLLAARHAADVGHAAYDVTVLDPVDGVAQATLRLNGRELLRWSLARDLFVDAAMQGRRLGELRDWIATLDSGTAEAARILRWATMMSRGRRIEIPERASDSKLRSGVCYTFQPDVARHALHTIGTIVGFAELGTEPLPHRAAHFGPHDMRGVLAEGGPPA